MRINIKIIILLTILPIFLVTGCISSRAPIPDRGIVQYYKPPAISNDTLDRRIDNIKTLLEENSLSDDRKDTAISILKVYDKIKSLDQENLTEKEYRKTVKLLFNTLVEVEQQYFYNGIVSKDTAGEIIFENYSELKKEIYEDYFTGNLKGVISGCDDLISRFGKSGLTPDLGIIFVEALSKSNMTSEALTVAKSILGAVENRPDLIRLLADTIELDLKMGETEDARLIYEKMVDIINDRNSLFKKAGGILAEAQGESSAVDESLKERIPGIDPEKSIQMKQLVDDVEKLISQKDFSGARLELVRRRLRAEEGPELELIEQLLKSVDKAEEGFAKDNSHDNLVIEDARRLIEEEKYEEALDIIEPIIVEGENYKAEKLKKEAIEKLIMRDKNIAAKLKIAASNEGDIKKKRDLLLRAKTIFQNLIDKYSESPLIDKVKRNISVVDEELIKLPTTSE